MGFETGNRMEMKLGSSKVKGLLGEQMSMSIITKRKQAR